MNFLPRLHPWYDDPFCSHSPRKDHTPRRCRFQGSTLHGLRLPIFSRLTLSDPGRGSRCRSPPEHRPLWFCARPKARRHDSRTSPPPLHVQDLPQTSLGAPTPAPPTRTIQTLGRIYGFRPRPRLSDNRLSTLPSGSRSSLMDLGLLPGSPQSLPSPPPRPRHSLSRPPDTPHFLTPESPGSRYYPLPLHTVSLCRPPVFLHPCVSPLGGAEWAYSTPQEVGLDWEDPRREGLLTKVKERKI